MCGAMCGARTCLAVSGRQDVKECRLQERLGDASKPRSCPVMLSLCLDKKKEIITTDIKPSY
jgi:hypothetical protein